MMAVAVNIKHDHVDVQDVHGYNPRMFVEKEKFLQNFQCAICKWIVKDCVEISCMNGDLHKNDIDSLDYNPIWCLKCLENHLNKNKQICPITGQKHDQNSEIRAVATRYTRRQVSRARVKCINSNRHDADDNGSSIDYTRDVATSSEDNKDNIDEYEIQGQLEGIPGTMNHRGHDNVMENEKSSSGLTHCQWKGLLCEHEKHIKDECQFVPVECPFNQHFDCCNNTNAILKCNLESMMTSDATYLSKHLKICFENYLDLKKNMHNNKEKDENKDNEIKTENNVSTGNLSAPRDQTEAEKKKQEERKIKPTDKNLKLGNGWKLSQTTKQSKVKGYRGEEQHLHTINCDFIITKTKGGKKINEAHKLVFKHYEIRKGSRVPKTYKEVKLDDRILYDRKKDKPSTIPFIEVYLENRQPEKVAVYIEAKADDKNKVISYEYEVQVNGMSTHEAYTKWLAAGGGSSGDGKNKRKRKRKQR